MFSSHLISVSLGGFSCGKTSIVLNAVQQRQVYPNCFTWGVYCPGVQWEQGMVQLSLPLHTGVHLACGALLLDSKIKQLVVLQCLKKAKYLGEKCFHLVNISSLKQQKDRLVCIGRYHDVWQAIKEVWHQLLKAMVRHTLSASSFAYESMNKNTRFKHKYWKNNHVWDMIFFGRVFWTLSLFKFQVFLSYKCSFSSDSSIVLMRCNNSYYYDSMFLHQDPSDASSVSRPRRSVICLLSYTEVEIIPTLVPLYELSLWENCH